MSNLSQWPLELAMFEALKEKHRDGDKFIKDYNDAKIYLDQNVYPYIYASEPQLTAHDSSHIQNVLDNAEKLLGDDIKLLSGVELYLLGILILFHDVGNYDKRDGHTKNIASFYNKVRNNNSEFNRERTLVITGAGAHGGIAKDSSSDTLKDVEQTDHLAGNLIRLRDLAAILRFADELAEGPQRTSDLLLEKAKIDKESRIHHLYARATAITIDRSGQRIAITYDIDVDLTSNATEFAAFLEYLFNRMIKTDEERKYNKYYTTFLLPFKSTTVVINFYIKGELCEADQIRIELKDDIPLPGSSKWKNKSKVNGISINIDKLWKKFEKNYNK